MSAVDSQGSIIGREVHNTSADDAVLTGSQHLHFTPQFFGLDYEFGYDEGSTTGYLALGHDHLVREVFDQTSENDDGTTTVSLSVIKIPHVRMNPGALTTSGIGPDHLTRLYAITRSGILRRWRLDRSYRTLGERHTLATGLGDVTTLAWHARIKRAGRATDVLFATTSDGRLVEITAPIKHPSDTQVWHVGSGFRRYAALVAGPYFTCYGSGDPSLHAFLTVDEYANTARWWTLDTVHHPRHSTLTRLGRVTDASWSFPAFGPGL